MDMANSISASEALSPGRASHTNLTTFSRIARASSCSVDVAALPRTRKSPPVNSIVKLPNWRTSKAWPMARKSCAYSLGSVMDFFLVSVAATTDYAPADDGSPEFSLALGDHRFLGFTEAESGIGFQRVKLWVFASV